MLFRSAIDKTWHNKQISAPLYNSFIKTHMLANDITLVATATIIYVSEYFDAMDAQATEG